MTGLEDFLDDKDGAIFDDDREYRYRLWRTLDASKPTVAFLMLNPSTADETDNDRTISRCISFAENWGYGRLEVGNLFAFSATNPDELRNHPEPVGSENDRHLEEIVDDAELVVAAWGNDGSIQGRGREVAARFRGELHALMVNKTGHPQHPLYVDGDTNPSPFTALEEGDRDGL